MLENFKNNLQYRLKILQIRFRTWKNAREISKAYTHPVKKRTPPDWRFLARYARTAGISFGVLTTGVFLVFGIWKLAQFLPEPGPEAAIVTTPNPPPAPVKKEKKSVSLVPAVTGKPVPDPHRAADIKPEEKVGEVLHVAQYSGRNLIVTNKATKTMYVYEKGGSGRLDTVRTFKVAVGEHDGPKQNAGDKKTPEGNYFIIGRKDKSELTDIYGPLAYVLDYPNEEDRAAKRTGDGIWIHGTARDSVPGQTRGCVGLFNKDLVDLSTLLKEGIGTPVIIVHDPDLQNPLSVVDFDFINNRRKSILRAHQHIQESFAQLLIDWKSAWESKDISRYKEYYHISRFNGQGLSWKVWEQRKLRTFEIYEKIDISLDNILITDFSDNSAVVKFWQLYETDKNSMENGKKLIFEKENGAWKIIGETTVPKEELLL